MAHHISKNITLIVLSLIFLPFDGLFTLLAWLSNYAVRSPSWNRRKEALQNPSFRPKIVLVTGVGMSKGLALARCFYEAGHTVIGADFSNLACGRVSSALTRFYTVDKPNAKSSSGPYIQSLLDVIQGEKVDLWVSCSGVASAAEDGEAKEIVEARTSCKAVQFNVATTQTLHEKDTFIAHTKGIGLPVPDTRTMTSLDAVEVALQDASEGRKYIMKPIGMDDANRGDMTLLPKATTTETKKHLSKLKISEKSPWILQQYINGPEFCTHSLVVKGQVRAFVACPSAELLMHYEALANDSKLSQAMLKFTETYAAAGGEDFTGHLSFDFMVNTSQMEGATAVREDEDVVLYPIECNPRAHTAVVLFNDTPGLAEAYLSLLTSTVLSNATETGSLTKSTMITPQRNDKHFWIGHDLVELLLRSFLALCTLQADASIVQLFNNIRTLVKRVITWRDGTFERWDPAPWWWLYHVYWPMQFWSSLTSGRKWSRINVSTTKMFAC